jgi:xanthosine utilization system XapX-like protein
MYKYLTERSSPIPPTTKVVGLLGQTVVKDAYGAARAARLSRRGTSEEGEGER